MSISQRPLWTLLKSHYNGVTTILTQGPCEFGQETTKLNPGHHSIVFHGDITAGDFSKPRSRLE